MRGYTSATVSSLREDFNTTWQHIDRKRNPSFERVKSSMLYEVDYREALLNENNNLYGLSETFADSANIFEMIACSNINDALNKYASIEAGNWSWEDIETQDQRLPSREDLINQIRAYSAEQHQEDPRAFRALYDQYIERLEIDILKDVKDNTPVIDLVHS